MRRGIWAFKADDWDPSPTTFQRLAQLLDTVSQEKIGKYYHEIDSKRCLIGCLLPRAVLQYLDLTEWKEASFGRTCAGRPYTTSPIKKGGAFDFNISHDSSYVICAFCYSPETDSTNSNLSAFSDPKEVVLAAERRLRVGCDVMKVALPRWASGLDDFVETLQGSFSSTEKVWLEEESQLGTALALVTGDDSSLEEARLRRVFRIWTLKEAFTKAVGYGLGLDFSRVSLSLGGQAASTRLGELAAVVTQVKVDGRSHQDWKFEEIELRDEAMVHLVAVAWSPVCVNRFDGKASQGAQQTDIEIKTINDLLPDLI